VGDDVEPAVSAGRGDLRPEAHARKQVRDEVLELDAVDLALSLFTTKSRECVSMRSALGASSAVTVAASSLSSGTGPNTSGSTTWLPPLRKARNSASWFLTLNRVTAQPTSYSAPWENWARGTPVLSHVTLRLFRWTSAPDSWWYSPPVACCHLAGEPEQHSGPDADGTRLGVRIGRGELP